MLFGMAFSPIPEDFEENCVEVIVLCVWHYSNTLWWFPISLVLVAGTGMAAAVLTFSQIIVML